MSGARDQPLAVAVIAVSGAALIVWGFFLPWFDGAAEFAGRDFSGFDLARLVRNFEIAASSGEEGRLRVTAVVLYLVPALAVNGAVFAVVPPLRRWAVWALGLGAGYAAVVLAVAGMLTVVSWTELERVMGDWAIGYFVSFTGVGMLGSAAVMRRAG